MSEPVSTEPYFRSDLLKADLGRRTARSGVVTLFTQSIKFLLSISGTIILSRLLTPEDYGLVGMVAVVTGFVLMFKDLGLSSATVQREEINAGQISTLFWVNVWLSVGVMLVTASLSPLVSWFYGEPRLTRITIGLSIGFLFGGLTVQHEALLRRTMRFMVLAIAEVSSLILGILVGVGLAWKGTGYWALVGSQLAQGISYAVLIWLFCKWRPGLPVRNSGVRTMLAFGRNLTGFSILNYFARNIDNMLVGRFWGSGQLGLYARAYQLLILPIDQINAPLTAVAVPALSRLADAPERYRMAYLRLLDKVALLTMPLMAFMVVTSDWVVLLLLGPKWLAVSRIFSLLGISGIVQPICNTSGWLFISQDRTRHLLQWGLIGPMIVIVSILVGLPWGAVGVAASYSLTFTFVITPLLFWFVCREGPVSVADIYRTIAPSLCAAFAVFGGVLAFRQFSTLSQPLLRISIALVIAIVITIVVLALLPSSRRSLLDLKNVLRLIIRREEPSAAM